MEQHGVTCLYLEDLLSAPLEEGHQRAPLPPDVFRCSRNHWAFKIGK